MKMRWKFINTALVAFFAVPFVSILLNSMLLLLFFVNVPDTILSASSIIDGYREILIALFYPTITKFKIVWLYYLCVWLCGYFASAQPYHPGLRIIGAIIGIVMSIAWLGSSIILLLLSGIH
jgi:hypothetical protein